MRLILPEAAMQNDRSRCDPTLIKAIARGRAWFEELAAGRARSLRELADARGRRPQRLLTQIASPPVRCEPALASTADHNAAPWAYALSSFFSSLRMRQSALCSTSWFGEDLTTPI